MRKLRTHIAGILTLVGALAGQSAVLWSGETIKTVAGPTTHPSLDGAELKRHVDRIDSFIKAGLDEQGLAPNVGVSDQVFLRRIYLDIVGRIPTMEEALSFLKNLSPTKRRDLINDLVGSAGHVSREFNYWADLLRVQSRMRNVPGQPYVEWIKDSLRDNKPYDEMVRELITADGYIWDNGAAGYYLRDAGMPLDHMANTFQVFLGTQLVCAQCHDHPYDDFTQVDYYQQAAYIYGVKTNDREAVKQFRKLNQRRGDDDISPETKRVARNMIRPLRYRVNETKAKLRLPDDYQYDDAKPKSLVTPKPIFGDVLELSEGESPRDGYAKWLTSAENPRFATVIANRLWKRTMGVGIIEPVDDLSDGYTASNPLLMDYLTTLMVDLDFDLQAYLKVLYNTKTYQRVASRDSWKRGDQYFFPGPLLKRMSAEQLWDSVAGLIVEDIDERPGNVADNRRYTEAQYLVGMDTDAIVKLAEERAESEKEIRELRAEQTKLRNQLRRAQKNQQNARTKELRERQTTVGKEIRRLTNETRLSKNENRRGQATVNDSRWKGLSRDLVRASETVSPAPPKHFLRQFGQSDRETIENANTDASVPQILTLMNGPIYENLLNKKSLFRSNVERATNPNELLDVIYLSILSRFPSPDERAALVPGLQQQRKEAGQDLTWALLNTRQFAFVQ